MALSNPGRHGFAPWGWDFQRSRRHQSSIPRLGGSKFLISVGEAMGIALQRTCWQVAPTSDVCQTCQVIPDQRAVCPWMTPPAECGWGGGGSGGASISTGQVERMQSENI